MNSRFVGWRFDRVLHQGAVLPIIAVLVLVAVTGTSCGTKSFSPETQKRLEQVMDRKMKDYDVPGMVVGVWVPGQGTWVKAKGKADLETGQELKSTMKFRIASITKPFTTTLLLLLVDDGKLSLEDRLSKYFPDVPNSENITVRQLCNHTSGLFDFEDDEKFDDTVRNKPLAKWTPRQLVDIGISHDPYFAPGHGYHYSNTNFILLGMIIEKVTGSTVARELDKRIFDRLGLKNTSLPRGPDITGEYSHGYYNDYNDGKLVDITRTDQSAYWTTGAIISNLDDLAIWAKVLADGKLLSRRSHLGQMTFVEVPGGEAFSEKYGLGVAKLKGWVGHDGANYGYHSSMFHLPSEDATIIVLTNKFPPKLKEPEVIADETFMDIADILFPGTGFPEK